MKKSIITTTLVLLAVLANAQEENLLFTNQLKQIIAGAKDGFPAFQGKLIEKKPASAGLSESVFASRDKVSMADSAVIVVSSRDGKVISAKYEIFIRLEADNEEAERLFRQFSADIKRVVGKDFDMKPSTKKTSEDEFTMSEHYSPMKIGGSNINFIRLFRSSYEDSNLVSMGISYDKH